MTKAEREHAKESARVSAVRGMQYTVRSDVASAAEWDRGFYKTFYRERARLYRIALRAVREEVRRGK